MRSCMPSLLPVLCRELVPLSCLVWLLHSSLSIHPLAVISILLLAVQLWCWVQAAQRIEFIAGHRAGAKGYTGELARYVDLQAAAAARVQLNGAPAAVAMGMCMVT